MSFRPDKYKCYLCNYSSNIHQRYLKHTQTKKHHKRLLEHNKQIEHDLDIVRIVETTNNSSNIVNKYDKDNNKHREKQDSNREKQLIIQDIVVHNNNNNILNENDNSNNSCISYDDDDDNDNVLEKLHKIVYNIGQIQKNKNLNTNLSLKELYCSNNLKKDKSGCFQCICSKTFKYKNNLSRHKQNCYYCKILLTLINEVKDNQDILNLPINHLTQSYIYNKYGVTNVNDITTSHMYLENKTNNKDTELHSQIQKQNMKNTESISELVELCKVILEKQSNLSDTLIKAMNEPKIVNINNNIQNIKNNNINNIKNNNINIVQYLNNECKEAPNLTDFISQINVSYDDLLQVKNNGYIYGIERSLLNHLKHTDKTKRPIHCTDKKRKKFYVKEKDLWQKDEEHKHIDKAIKHVCTKQINTLQDFKKQNKDWIDNDGIREDVGDITAQICKIYTESGDKLKNKILTKLSEITTMKE
jgi:hypothetical protein